MQPLNEDEIKLMSGVLPNMANQLRESMSNLCMAMNTLAPPDQRDQDTKLDESTSTVTANCFRIVRLAANMSALAELSAGNGYHPVNDDIAVQCADICDKVSDLFEMCGVELRYSSQYAYSTVSLDPVLFERLLLNLLSNALKFTQPCGRVDVLLQRNKDRFVLSVSDNGCGMDQEHLDTVFDRYRVEGRLDPPPCGAGIGLQLCRRIALLHKGSMLVESKQGEGTRVIVVLPNVRSESKDKIVNRFDYAGGFNHFLLELSDALPSKAYLQRYLD